MKKRALERIADALESIAETQARSHEGPEKQLQRHKALIKIFAPDPATFETMRHTVGVGDDFLDALAAREPSVALGVCQHLIKTKTLQKVIAMDEGAMFSELDAIERRLTMKNPAPS